MHQVLWRRNDLGRVVRRALRLGDAVIAHHVTARARWLARWARSSADVHAVRKLEAAGAAALVLLDRACGGCTMSLRAVVREAYGRSPPMKEELREQRIQYLYGVGPRRPPASHADLIVPESLPLALERYHPLVRLAITDGDLAFRRAAVRHIMQEVPDDLQCLYGTELEVIDVIRALRVERWFDEEGDDEKKNNSNSQR